MREDQFFNDPAVQQMPFRSTCPGCKTEKKLKQKPREKFCSDCQDEILAAGIEFVERNEISTERFIESLKRATI